MAWRKSPPELIALFLDSVPATNGVEHRKMFGYPAAFLNGNLFAGLHQESFLLRLSERDREIACTKHGGAIFEPMPGRKMREYVALPSAILNRRRALAAWLKKAISYARGLPPKLKRSKAKTKRS